MKDKTIFLGYQKEDIEKAEYLFCEMCLSASNIANELKCNIKTIYAWRDKFGWTRSKYLKKEQINSLMIDICKIKDCDLRTLITNKLNKCTFSQKDINELILTICSIKSNSIRLNITSKLTAFLGI